MIRLFILTALLVSVAQAYPSAPGLCNPNDDQMTLNMGATTTTADGFTIAFSNEAPVPGDIIDITLDHATESTYKGLLLVSKQGAFGAGQFFDDSLPSGLGAVTQASGNTCSGKYMT